MFSHYLLSDKNLCTFKKEKKKRIKTYTAQENQPNNISILQSLPKGVGIRSPVENLLFSRKNWLTGESFIAGSANWVCWLFWKCTPHQTMSAPKSFVAINIQKEEWILYDTKLIKLQACGLLTMVLRN